MTRKPFTIIDCATDGHRHTLKRETFIEPDNTPYVGSSTTLPWGVLLVAIAAFLLVCTVASHPEGAPFGAWTWLLGVLTIACAFHGGRLVER